MSAHRLQFLFRPRFGVHPPAEASAAPGFAALQDAWQRIFPDSRVDARVDLEDWVENAVQRQVAMALAQRHPGSLELFVDTTGKIDLSGIRPAPLPGETEAGIAGRALDMSRPFLFGGAELRAGDFISTCKHLVLPSRDDMASADAYFHNPGFWGHAHRHMAFASYDDGEGDVPAESNVLNVLLERRDAGESFAFLKVAGTKRGEAQLRQQLVNRFEWTLIELAGRKDALLVQDCVEMKHEYRIFVVDGVPVAGAGCIEEFTPLNNDGNAFDSRTRENRMSPDGIGREVVARPDVVARYKAAAPGIVKDLIKGNPRMRTFVLDLCHIGDQVAVVEVNGARNAGLYAMKYDVVFDAKEATARRQLDALLSPVRTIQYESGETIHTECGNGRITYRPEWDQAKPWVSYWRGTAGLHFEEPARALAHFNVKYGAKLTLDASASSTPPRQTPAARRHRMR